MTYPLCRPLPAGAGAVLVEPDREPAWAAGMTAEDWDFAEWADAVAAEVTVECASRVCSEPATVALIFRVGCKCPADRRASWLLCADHLDRGLQELRERFEWRCDYCGLIGFWCVADRIEALS